MKYAHFSQDRVNRILIAAAGVPQLQVQCYKVTTSTQHEMDEQEQITRVVSFTCVDRIRFTLEGLAIASEEIAELTQEEHVNEQIAHFSSSSEGLPPSTNQMLYMHDLIEEGVEKISTENLFLTLCYNEQIAYERAEGGYPIYGDVPYIPFTFIDNTEITLDTLDAVIKNIVDKYQSEMMEEHDGIHINITRNAPYKLIPYYGYC